MDNEITVFAAASVGPFRSHAGMMIEMAKRSDPFIHADGITDEMVRRSCGGRFRLQLATVWVGVLSELSLSILYMILFFRMGSVTPGYEWFGIEFVFERETALVLNYWILIGIAMRLWGGCRDDVAAESLRDGPGARWWFHFFALILYLLSFIVASMYLSLWTFKDDDKLVYVRAISAWVGFFISMITIWS